MRAATFADTPRPYPHDRDLRGILDPLDIVPASRNPAIAQPICTIDYAHMNQVRETRGHRHELSKDLLQQGDESARKGARRASTDSPVRHKVVSLSGPISSSGWFWSIRYARSTGTPRLLKHGAAQPVAPRFQQSFDERSGRYQLPGTPPPTNAVTPARPLPRSGKRPAGSFRATRLHQPGERQGRNDIRS